MDNLPGGASSKKLTGFLMFWLTAIVTLVWAHWAYKNNDWAFLPYVLTTLTATGLVSFGINSSEKKKNLFGDQQNKNEKE